MIGIYKITNTDNGKVYIGQTKDFSHRQACHIYDMKVGRHKNPYMQADYFINPKAFKYEMICQCNADELDELERFYINKYKSDEHYFFNILDTTETPKIVEFNDKWKMYRGPLPAHFSRSINFKKGYTTQKEVRYNKDGSVEGMYIWV